MSYSLYNSYCILCCADAGSSRETMNIAMNLLILFTFIGVSMQCNALFTMQCLLVFQCALTLWLLPKTFLLNGCLYESLCRGVTTRPVSTVLSRLITAHLTLPHRI